MRFLRRALHGLYRSGGGLPHVRLYITVRSRHHDIQKAVPIHIGQGDIAAAALHLEGPGPAQGAFLLFHADQLGATAKQELVAPIAVHIAGDHIRVGPHPIVELQQNRAVRRLKQAHPVRSRSQQLHAPIAVAVAHSHQRLHLGIVAVRGLPDALAIAVQHGVQIATVPPEEFRSAVTEQIDHRRKRIADKGIALKQRIESVAISLTHHLRRARDPIDNVQPVGPHYHDLFQAVAVHIPRSAGMPAQTAAAAVLGQDETLGFPDDFAAAPID